MSNKNSGTVLVCICIMYTPISTFMFKHLQNSFEKSTNHDKNTSNWKTRDARHFSIIRLFCKL